MASAVHRQRARAAHAWVGVDAGKFHHVLVVRDAQEKDSKPVKFAATREGFTLAEAAIGRAAPGVAPAEVLVGIEFAGVYGWTLAHHLHARGYQVVSVLPRTTKAWGPGVHGSKLKTDAADAATVVDLTANGRFNAFPFLEPVYAELRHLTSGIQRLVKLRTGAVNRTKSVLQTVWPEFEGCVGDFAGKVTPLAVLAAYPGPAAFLAAPKRKVLALIGSASRGQKGEALYAALHAAATDTVAIPGAEAALVEQVRQLIDQIRLYDVQAEELEAAMERVMAPMPDAAALRTIPNVGVRTAGVFLGSIGDVHAYEAPEQVLRLAGLNLVTRESGVMKGSMRISKQGRSEVRQFAYLLSLSTVQKGGVFRAPYEALVARNGGRKKAALVAISRDVLKLLFSIARDRRTFTPEAPARTGRLAAGTAEATA